MIERGLQREGVSLWLHWPVTTGGELDPTTGARVGGTTSVEKEEIRAHVHQVKADSSLRRFTEIRVGDLILDLSAAVRPDDRPGCWIEYDGVIYRPKKLSEHAVSHLDHHSAGGTALRTVCFSPAQ